MTYAVFARNFSQAHDNKIHSDEIAKKFGFSGALVPGVAVFGHLVHPLVQRHGERWLGGSVSSVRFAKPAYHGDELFIEHSQLTSQQAATAWPGESFDEQSLASARGEVIATLESALLGQRPEPVSPEALGHPAKPSGRPEMQWNNVIPNQPFRSWEWHIDSQDNRRYVDEVADTNPLYTKYAHPHWILSTANSALTREYLMPAWIHVGSELCLHHPLLVGDTVTVAAVPLEKWERKGHQFVRLYLAFKRDELLTTEIVHTAIFRVAQ